MNYVSTMIIGFFVGIGVSYASTQAVIDLQARKVASLTAAYYGQEYVVAAYKNEKKVAKR